MTSDCCVFSSEDGAKRTVAGNVSRYRQFEFFMPVPH